MRAPPLRWRLPGADARRGGRAGPHSGRQPGRDARRAQRQEGEVTMRSQNKKFKSLRGIGTVRQVSGNWQVQLPVEGKTEGFEFAAAEAPPGAPPGKWQGEMSARGARRQG